MILYGQKKKSAHVRGAVAVARVARHPWFRDWLGGVIGLGGHAVAHATDRQTRARRVQMVECFTHAGKAAEISLATAQQTARPLCTTIVLPGRFDFVVALEAI